MSLDFCFEKIQTFYTGTYINQLQKIGTARSLFLFAPHLLTSMCPGVMTLSLSTLFRGKFRKTVYPVYEKAEFKN
jgi:hypothetical protein